MRDMLDHRSNKPWWLPVIVAVGGGLMILGAVIALLNPAMLLSKGAEINGAVRVYAGYLVSRNLAIGGLLLGALVRRARGALSVLMLLAGVIQILDAVIDGAEGRWVLVPGVAVLGIAFLFGANEASKASER
jgi:hypothetical protein